MHLEENISEQQNARMGVRSLLLQQAAAVMPFYPCLLPHPFEPRVLLLQGEAGFCLPAAEDLVAWFPNIAGSVARSLSAKLGIVATALRHIRSGDIDFCQLENHSADWTPPVTSRWVGVRELANLPLAFPVQREVVERWLAEAEREIPALRAPWERCGWYAEAVAWIETQLAARGAAATGAIEQVKAAWGESSILRVPTTDGTFYFKADYDHAPSEPALTLALADRWSDHVPIVVAADLERRWMLTRELDGSLLDTLLLSESQQAVQLFAQLQIDCSTDRERWLELGCKDFQPEKLPGYLVELLAELPAIQAGLPHGLSPVELQRLQQCMGRVETMCGELAELSIPTSLVMQDFRGGNVWKGATGYRFFDWSDTVIGHPFFSPIRFNRYIWVISTRLTERYRLGVETAYLEPWTRFQPMERLRRAFDLAIDVTPVYRSVSVYFKTKCLEPGTPWAEVLAAELSHELRMILAATESTEALRETSDHS